MQYMLLLYHDEARWAALPDAERHAIYGRYLAFTDELREAGGYVLGAPLQPTATATTVRVRAGEELVTDGPFAETKEALGGFFLVEAATLDDALAWAAKIPAASYGSVEVRPVQPVGEAPAG